MRNKFTLLMLLLFSTLLLSACGGGGGGGGGGSDFAVYGVAAEGEAINGTVYLTDSNGVRSDAVSIESDGSFSFNTSTLRAPYLLKAVSSESGMEYAAIAEGRGRYNITPFSHLAFLLAGEGNVTLAQAWDNTTLFENTLLSYETAKSDVNSMFSTPYDSYKTAVSPFTGNLYVGSNLDMILDDMYFRFNTSDAEISSKISGHPLIDVQYSSGGSPSLYFDNNTFDTINDNSYLTSISLSPAEATLRPGDSRTFAAVGSYVDGSVHNIDRVASWSIDNSSVASVDTGIVTGLSTGSALLTAALGSVSKTADITVSEGGDYLIGLSVTPVNPSVPYGNTKQLTATGIYYDSETQGFSKTMDVTKSADWASSAESVAKVGNDNGTKGLVTTIASGTATVTASLEGYSSSTNINVSNSELQYINISPSAPQIGPGGSVQFTATGIYTDSSTQDITGSVIWISDNSSVAEISNDNGTAGLAEAGDNTGTTGIVATKGGVTAMTTLKVAPVQITGIGVTPAVKTLAAGNTQQMTATGTYNDNSTSDVTSDAVWSTSTPSVATVDTDGVLTAVGSGTATVTAIFGGVSGTAQVTVKAAELDKIEVTPASPEVPLGLEKQMTATGIYSDGSKQNLTSVVTWQSSDTSVGVISNAVDSKGLFSTLTSGTSDITAALAGVSSAPVTVTVTSAQIKEIQLTPEGSSVPLGVDQQFTTTAVFTDNTTQNMTESCTWYITDPYAAVSNASGTKGFAKTIGEGTTMVRAVYGEFSDETSFTITPAELTQLQVSPVTPSVALGGSKQMNAVGIYTDNTNVDVTSQATWASSDGTVASISNAGGSEGLAVSLATGTSTLCATMDNITDSTVMSVTPVSLQHITVTPANQSLPLGNDQQYTATGIYSDLTTEDLTASVTWSADNASVASISNAGGSEGLASSAGTGNAVITADYNSVTGTAKLTVTPATLTSIVVNPINASIAQGNTQQYTATGYYSDSTSQNLTNIVAWTSDNAAVASISNAVGSQGIASSVGTGSANITASYDNVTRTVPLTVTAAQLESIDIAPANPSIVNGTNQQFTATGNYSDGSTQDVTTQVTWLSSDVGVASISNAGGSEGLATSAGTGTTTILAALDGKAGSTNLTVTAATLQSIAITPADPSIPLGTTQQFTATGTYSDTTTQDITTQVTWQSDDDTVAVVSNAGGSEGLTTSMAQGTANITADMGGITGTTSITLTAPQLQSVSVLPANTSIAVGDTLQYTAIGNYSGGGISDITDQATWVSTTASVASVGNTQGVDKGLATGIVAGSTNIEATLDGITGTTPLQVTGLPLIDITVTPADPSILTGANIQFTATGTYSDFSTEDISNSCTWVMDNTDIATVDATGLATGDAVNTGTTNVRAQKSGVEGSTSITVN
ncbi:beta strand repeat-containing protein [Limisalsivibrio acetivorans]|uniref:beta strand repeat-containing protein n=1 Tax=Limisalsivibrio acetivorans TaxID=1304888 RepID=UPI000424F679|nr:Ig-like domain-containing protein [Limisalsivibrio acetivorans]